MCPETICVCGEQPAAGGSTDETQDGLPTWQPPSSAVAPQPAEDPPSAVSQSEAVPAWTFADSNLDCQENGLAVACLTKSCAAYAVKDGVLKVDAASLTLTLALTRTLTRTRTRTLTLTLTLSRCGAARLA